MEMLPDTLQQQVLEYVQILKASGQPDVPGRKLLRFAGFIPSDDLQQIKQAITDINNVIQSSRTESI